MRAQPKGSLSFIIDKACSRYVLTSVYYKELPSVSTGGESAFFCGSKKHVDLISDVYVATES